MIRAWLFGHFPAANRHVARRLDANAHAPAANLDNGNLDSVAKNDALAALATQNQHLFLPENLIVVWIHSQRLGMGALLRRMQRFLPVNTLSGAISLSKVAKNSVNSPKTCATCPWPRVL